MPRKLHSDEPLPHLNGLTVADFWSWAYSDILSNRNRAIFAEFLVGSALAVLDKPRIEWDGYDLLYHDKKIEVKASGFLQSWKQLNISKVTFDISSKNSWDAETNTFAGKLARSADCYVFCLFAETDPEKANVLDVKIWEFYIISTEQLVATVGEYKSLALSKLRRLCNPVRYDEIKGMMDNLLF